MNTPLNVLLLEDRAEDAKLILHELREAGFDPHSQRVDVEEDFLAALDPGLDLIIADHNLPGWTGSAAITALQRSGLEIPLILISGSIDDESAVAVMRRGAADYLLKDRLARLGVAVSQVLEQSRLRREKTAMLRSLKEAEAKYRGIFEHASEGILQSRPDGIILAANPALARIFGYGSVAELLRERPRTADHYVDLARRAEFQRIMHEAGVVKDFEAQMRHRDGRLIWVVANIHYSSNELGEPIYEGTIKDITDRKQAEETLRVAMERTVRSRHLTVAGELALLGLLAVVFYGLSAHFHWFEAASSWILANRGPGQMDEMVVTAIFLMLGFAGIAFQHWRESATDAAAQRQAQEAMRLLHAGLEDRVKLRTAELGKVNEELRAEVGERTRAELALRLQSSALTAAANAIVITDRHGVVVWANPAFTELSGYALAEAAGRNLRELVESDRQDRATNELPWSTVRAGHVWHGELVSRRKDGRTFPEEQTITPVRNAAGEITHFIAIKLDLTKRKRAEELLRVSERKFQAVFEEAAVGMVLAEGPRGRFVVVNRHFCTMLGYSAAELLELDSHDLTHPDDLAADTELLAQISQGAIREFTREKRYRKKDGTYLWGKAHVAALDPTEGQPSLRIGVIADITERKLAEEALQVSEVRFRSLLQEVSSVAVQGYGPDGIAQYWNQASEQLYGYTAAEAIGRNLLDLIIPPEMRPDVQQAMEQMARTGQPIPASELTLQRKDGSRVTVYSTHTILRLPGRQPELFCIDIDLTERLRAEAALRTSEERYRRLVERAPDVIFSIGATGGMTTLNPAFETVTGWPRDRWLGRAFNDLLHPDDQATARERFRAVLAREPRSPLIEVRVRTAAGGFRDLEITGFSSVVGADSIEIQGIGRDVSERKLVEQQLREQNEILSNAQEGVMIVNLANEVTFWNRGAGEIYGVTAAEALGRPPEVLLGISDAGQIAGVRAAVMRDGNWQGEVRGQTRLGRKVTLEYRITLICDEQGRPRARLNYFADITEKKLLEEKFLHAQRLESIGMLAAGIAHDLNNVLAPILFAEPMLRRGLSEERDLKLLDTLGNSARRGAGLVKQILGFVHSTTGEFGPTQVKHLARDIFNLIEETFPKSIRLEHNIPNDAWPVQGNPTQLHQVLLNLCVNARDAMPAGGTLGITAANRRLDAAAASQIDGARPGDWLVLTVSDTGSGMTNEVRERIWTPFFTTKPVGKGTGLGLTTIRSIVTSHAGFITLETAQGKGTTFTVFLPAVAATPAGRNITPPKTDHTGHGELILIVDDDAAIRDLIGEILENYGYRILTCADGLEALHLFKSRPKEVALVITDIDMPRLGGLAFAQALLQLKPELRIVAMSGLSHQGAASLDLPTMRSLTHGFLTKPFTAGKLLAAVHQLLPPAGH